MPQEPSYKHWHMSIWPRSDPTYVQFFIKRAI
jgi:hypothetical protein